MTCRTHTLTHRLVSIRGQRGQIWHVPPKVAIDPVKAEVADNAKVTKLTQIYPSARPWRRA